MTVANDATADLLTAIYSTLSGDATLVGMVGTSSLVAGAAKIYARPPAEENMPYITFGDVNDVDDSVDISFGQTFLVDITVWQQFQSTGNEGPGFTPLLAMAARIRALLHEIPMSIANGRNIIVQRIARQRVLEEPDGMSNRAILTLSTIIGHA